MRLDQLLLVLACVGTAASAASSPHIEHAVHARQLFESGVTLERLGQYQRAIDVLTEAIRTRALKREDAARAVFDRGVAYDALGDTRRAIADYSAALRLDSKLAAALSNRANAFRLAGKLEEAKRDYFAALRCPGVDRQYPYYGLGMIAAKLGDRETARDYFQKALAADPSFALAAASLSSLKRVPLPAPAPIIAAPSRPAAGRAARVAVSPPPQTADLPAGRADAGGSQARHAGEHPVLRRAISDNLGQPESGVQVQLGAYRDEQAATEAWNRIVAAEAVLRGLHPIIVVADLPGRGRFWRLRTAAPDARAAKMLCKSLASNGQDCLIVRN